MGRKTNALLKGFRAAKCLTLLKVATARIKVARNRRSISAKQMRGEIAQLMKSGQDAQVYITKADALIKQENMVAVYDLLDQYCHAIVSRFPAIELQRNCPADVKEAIASIIYAAPRCIELTELSAVKDAFVAKYGKEFAAAASELRPDCGVNTQIVELLSIRPATGDMKLKLMKEICKEHKLDWMPGEALGGLTVATSSAEAKLEPMQAAGTLGSIKVNALGGGGAGPSKTAPLQGAPKHEANANIGLPEAMVSAKAGGDILFATNVSGLKKSPSSDGDAATGKPSVSESFNGVKSTVPSTKYSSKAAGLAADVSEVDDMKISAFEEEDARRLRARILQSLQGGSFVDSGIEAETNAEKLENAIDVQDGISDSDSDSFVSAEEERCEDDVGPSSHGATSRKESFRDNAIQDFREDDVEPPLHAAASRKESFRENSKQGFTKDDVEPSSHGAASRKESFRAISNQGFTQDDGELSSHTAASRKESFRENLIQEDDVELSSRGAASRKGSFRDNAIQGFREDDVEPSLHAAASRKESFRDNEIQGFAGDDVEVSSLAAASRKGSFRDNSNQGLKEADLKHPSLSKKHSDSAQEDLYFSASIENFGVAMEIHEGILASSNLSILTSKSSLEDMHFKVNSKKAFNADQLLEKERRMDSLERGKLAEAHSVHGLQEDKMRDELKDNFLRVSSKKSSNAEEIMEELGRKDSVNMGKLVEPLSAEELNEGRKLNEKVGEELFVETNDKEGLQRKDFLEDRSAYALTKSSVISKLTDESCLHSDGINEVTPSVDSTGIKVTKNSIEECSLDSNDVGFVPGERSRLPTSETFKDQSGSEGVFDEETSSAAGKEACLSNGKLPELVCDDAPKVLGKGPPSNFENTLETGGGESGGFPAAGKDVKEPVGASSSSAFAALENNQDFAAAAKAIAAEAARLAVLDYAKRLAESSSIPLDLGELSKLGIAFEQNNGGPQVTRISKSEGKSEYADGEGPGYAENRESYENNSDHLDADPIKLNHELSKPLIAGAALDFDSSNLSASIAAESTRKPHGMVSELEAINPFATSVAINTYKDTNPPSSEVDDEEVSWLDMKQSKETSKLGNSGPDDHLDIFFRRKTPWMSDEQNPMFHEERFSYPKLKPNFMEGMPYDGSVTKMSSLQEHLFSKPLFDTLPEGQNTVFKGSSGSLKSPVFHEGEGGSFKIPVFDEVPEPYDMAFSSGYGLDESNGCSAVAEKRGSQSSTSQKSPASFDPEPEPCFDKVSDEEELSSSPPKGQLKWQSKKPINSVEHGVARNQSTFDASDTPLGVSGNTMSRRSRRQPKAYDDSKHHGDSTNKLTSRISLLPQQDNEPDRKGEDHVGGKKILGREQVRPSVLSGSAMSQRLPDPHKWGTSEADYDSTSVDEWDSTSIETKSTTTIKSPTSLENRQKMRPADLYFPETDNLARSSAGTSMSRKTNKSPTGMTRQQLMPHGNIGVEEDHVGMEDDPAGNRISYNVLRIRKDYPLDMVEDEFSEELQEKYKLSSQTSELSKRTSAGSGFDNKQQQGHRQKPGMKFEYEHYREDGGERLRTRLASSSQQQKRYTEEEPYLVSRYGPLNQEDEPSDYRMRNKSRITNSYGSDRDEDEEDGQQYRTQEKPGIRYKDVSESSRTRPMPTRQQQKYIEEEEPYMVSNYQPTIWVEEPLDSRSGNNLRVPKLHQLGVDVVENNKQMGSEYKHYREDVSGSSRTRPMARSQQPNKYNEEGDFISRYTTRIQDGESLEYQSSNKSRRPKPYQTVNQGNEDLQTDDSGDIRWHRRRPSWEQDALESGYVHYKEATAGGNRISTSRLSAGQKPSDFTEVLNLASGYEPLKQSNVNWVEGLLPNRQQEKKRIEEVDLGLRYSMPTATDDGLLERQEDVEEQFIPRMSSQQNQNSLQKQSMTEEEEVHENGEKQHIPSHSKKNHRMEIKDSVDELCELQHEKQRNKSTSLSEGQQEPSGSPSYNRKTDSRLEDNSSKSSQQELEQQVGGTSARNKTRPQEEEVKEQQEKAMPETEPLSGPHQSRAEEEGANGKQDKLGSKSQLLTQQPSQSASLPLESSVSDPIVLATIPPPLKKKLTSPPSTTVNLESSASAPSPSKSLEAKVPKVPQKPPNLQELAANFEALLRARKGE